MLGWPRVGPYPRGKLAHAGLLALGICGACSDTVWVDPLSPPPWEEDASTESSSSEDTRASSEDTHASSEEESDTDGEEDSGDESTDEESLQEVFVEFICEEDGSDFYPGLSEFFFHEADGQLVEQGVMNGLDVAPCPACPKSFALTVVFYQAEFEAESSIVTFGGLGEQSFYRFELCADENQPASTTSYGESIVTMPLEPAGGEGLTYRLYTGNTVYATLPGQERSVSHTWPSTGLASTGEAFALATARIQNEQNQHEVVALSFQTAPHQPTVPTQLQLDDWAPAPAVDELLLYASEPRYIRNVHFQQGYRGVPIKLNPTLFKNFSPGEWTAPDFDQVYPYQLLPNAFVTDSYLGLRITSPDEQAFIDFDERRDYPIAAATDVALLAPFLSEVVLPTEDDPRYRWAVEESEAEGSRKPAHRSRPRLEQLVDPHHPRHGRFGARATEEHRPASPRRELALDTDGQAGFS